MSEEQIAIPLQHVGASSANASGSTPSVGRSVTRTAVSGLILNLLTNASLYVGGIITIRGLTREAYAEFNVVVSFVSLLALLADLGLTPMFTRLFAEAEVKARTGNDERGALLGSLLLLRFSLAIVVSFLIWLLAPQFGYSAHTVQLMLVTMVTLFISSRLMIVRAVGESFLKAQGRYHFVSFFALLDALAFAGCLALLSYQHLTVEGVVAVYSFCHLPGLIFLVVTITRWLRTEHIRLQVDTKRIKSVLFAGVPLSLGTAFFIVHTQVDPLFLDKLGTANDVSAYSASLRLMTAMIFIPTVIVGVIAPEVTKYMVARDQERGKRIATLGIQLTMVIAGAAALGLLCLAKYLVVFLFGERYSDAAGLIQLLGWLFIPYSFATFMIDIVIAEGKPWYSTIYASIIMLCTLAGDMLFIPTHGAWGAMGSKFTGVLLGAIAFLILTRWMRSFDLKEVAFFLSKLLLGVACGIAAYYMTAPFGAVVQVASVLTSYAILLLATQAVHKQDLQLILQQLRKR